MNRSLIVAALAALVAGCGGGEMTTQMPDMKMGHTAPPIFLGSPDGGTAPDETCLGSRKDPAPPTMDTMVSGTIKDFQDSNPVEGAIVAVYTSPQQVVDGKPATMSAPSDAMGNYTVTVPAGFYRVIFGNSGGKAVSNGTMVDTIPAFELDRVFSDKDRVAVKTSTRDAIPSIVGITPDDTLGVIAGTVHDCNNKIIGGATISVTTTPAYDQSNIFYFITVNGSAFPSRNAFWTSGDPGVYAALNVPPGTAVVTATGVVGSGAPQTLGSASIPVLKGSIVIADLLPTPGK